MPRRTVVKELAGLPLMSGCTAHGRGVAAPPVLHLRSAEPGWPAALTQALGWTGAWTSPPSACAVLAASSADVAAAMIPAGKTIALSRFGRGEFSRRWRLV